MRVDAGSCGKGVGCLTGSDAESDADEEAVSASVDEVLDVPGGSAPEVMPKSAVLVAESTRSGVAILRRTTRTGSEQEVMNIAVWISFAFIRVTKLKVNQISAMVLFEPHAPLVRQI